MVLQPIIILEHEPIQYHYLKLKIAVWNQPKKWQKECMKITLHKHFFFAAKTNNESDTRTRPWTKKDL